GYAARYANPFVPGDLRALPGTWQEHLPGYYGIIARIDQCVGRIFAALEAQGELDNTIVVFLSDHGCHFRTRNNEYKRSCHDSSIRIPLLMRGPGLDRRLIVPEPVGLVDVPPTLLDAAGLPAPTSMQGRALLPLVRRDTDGWPEEVFIQISESMVGRALRAERWTYCAVAPDKRGNRDPGSDRYVDAYLYDNFADPHQLVNLVGRRGYGDICADLRARLVARMVAAGEPEPEITPYAGNPV
ncbi:MAG: sulfatase-like hydrolase/transferase, partial [Chloroflexota bacterium]